MPSGIEVSGFGDLFKNLDLTSRKINTAANNALREGAKVVETAIIANTPVSNEVKAVHAKDNVIINNVKTDGGNKSIDIGYGNTTFWYMWFLEKGTYDKGVTKGIKPQNNVQRAWQGSYSESFLEIATYMRSKGLM